MKDDKLALQGFVNLVAFKKVVAKRGGGKNKERGANKNRAADFSIKFICPVQVFSSAPVLLYKICTPRGAGLC